VAVAVASLAIALGWFAWHSANQRWAREQIPEIMALAKAGRTFEAYNLAVQVRKYLPDEPKLTALMAAVSTTLNVTSSPRGAHVFLKRFIAGPADEQPPWTPVGTTPLNGFELARCDYLVSVEHEGYEPFQRTWSNEFMGGPEAPIWFDSTPIDARLFPLEEARKRPEMVFIPGHQKGTRLGRFRPTTAKATLDDFFIDQFEVTNRDYKAFVDAKGYETDRYWMRRFMKDGRELSRAEAIAMFTDRTGKPGPRGWSDGTYPPDLADHPVTEVTWYEAAAYAAFRGKSLPTIFQWEKAAKHGVTENILDVTMPWGLFLGSIERRANLGTRGTVPVGSFEFGVSPFGCHDMAGNVAEWCLNETSNGFITSGGSWASYPQAWDRYGAYPGFYSPSEIGFRCVLNPANPTSDQGAKRIDLNEQPPLYTPEPEAKVRSWIAEYYEYKKDLPAEPKVSVDDGSDLWRRERIEYNGADGDRAIAYLYLPKQSRPPYQVIHLLPPGDVTHRFRTIPQSIEYDYSPYIQSGRAVFAVVLPGYLERDHLPDRRSAVYWREPEYVEANARDIEDLRRGLDYLVSRPDVDPRGIAFLGCSFGNAMMVLPAIEPRYRAVMFSGCGLGQTDEHEAANAVNFVPLIGGEKLLIHGEYDEGQPLKTAALPLFNMLSGKKGKLIYQGGHRPKHEELVGDVIAWLDGVLGPVKKPSQK
jgi:formylglycine-generating enzyme required for sulfatase activity/dienelactone hydrolase